MTPGSARRMTASGMFSIVSTAGFPATVANSRKKD